ncbi:hypothetical protein LMG23992_01715 [Cupriavidus laharis]|uniref:TagK domain-containing protein n=1 Tax=Cupriavidus laharis TaxID=151654 RepID=A0ABM8WT79_9BURK|nr:TagK domain-containing protein [Cupriavidus laharis]CAG9170673.1 hypothetical protein LMG23992_01715 [Cupriavidus laharis]
MDSRQPEAGGTPLIDPLTGDTSSTSWPWWSAAHPEAADPFSLLPQAAGGVVPQTDARGSTDVLEQIKREAEAVLRDPDYVSAHAALPDSGAASTGTLPGKGDPGPLRPFAHKAASDGSLMDMLDVARHIDVLLGAPGSPDDQQFFAVAPAPDVLRLFAGDIVPTRRRDVAVPLTRREHHLISMDSAYRPAQAQTPESDHDA